MIPHGHMIDAPQINFKPIIGLIIELLKNQQVKLITICLRL